LEKNDAKISDDLSFSHSPVFLDFRPCPTHKPSYKAQKYNCTPKFLLTFSPHSLEIYHLFPRNLSFFAPVFDHHTCKVTTTTAQFTFYNCKWHFTTAEIV